MTTLFDREESLKMDAAVATIEKQEVALAIPTEYQHEGMEDIGREDLVIPRLRVIQPTSKLDGPQGSFHMNLTGEAVHPINAVLLKVTKSRVCWDADDLAAPPVCASDNTKTPRADYAGRYATACAECPMAQWGDDHKPPECRLTYNFLAVDIDHDDTPFIISLSGASVKQAKKAISVFYLARKPLYSRPVVISSVLMTNDKGRYYEIAIVPNGAGKTFDWQRYREMYQAYSSVVVGADTEQTIDTDKAQSGVPDLESEEIPF